MIDIEPIRNNLVFCHIVQMSLAVFYIGVFAYGMYLPHPCPSWPFG